MEYHYKLSFDTNSRIAYRTIDKTWYDADTSSQPSALSSDAFSTQSSALVNPQYVWIGNISATNTDFYISFDNPYYEQPVAVLMEDLRSATPVSSPSSKSFTYKSGSGTIADPWIYGEAYYSTGALVNSTDTAKTIKWPASNYTGEGSGWADNDTASYPEVSNTGSTINITRFSNPHFSFTDPYYNHLPPA